MDRGGAPCLIARSSMTLLWGLFQTSDLRVGRSGTTQLTPGGGERKTSKKEQEMEKVMSPQNDPLGGSFLFLMLKLLFGIFGRF